MKLYFTNLACIPTLRNLALETKRPPALLVQDILAEGCSVQPALWDDQPPLYMCNTTGSMQQAWPELPWVHSAVGCPYVVSDNHNCREPTAFEISAAKGYDDDAVLHGVDSSMAMTSAIGAADNR